jgi:hypothetical protein
MALAGPVAHPLDTADEPQVTEAPAELDRV